MKKVLVIAYNFPPKGGPGVQRSVKLVSNFREFGYEPIVLTIDYEDNYKFNDLVDESLLKSLPVDVKIHRIPSYIPYKLITVLRKLKLFRLFWYFLYPLFWEQSAMWPWKSFKKVKKIIKEEKIDLVYTSSGPFSTMILGRKIQKKNKIKWVADLRDPFTDAYSWQFPSKLHWMIMRMFEKFYFSKPDMLIVNTEEVRKLYLKRKLVPVSKIKVITNGY